MTTACPKAWKTNELTDSNADDINFNGNVGLKKELFKLFFFLILTFQWFRFTLIDWKRTREFKGCKL